MVNNKEVVSKLTGETTRTRTKTSKWTKKVTMMIYIAEFIVLKEELSNDVSFIDNFKLNLIIIN